MILRLLASLALIAVGIQGNTILARTAVIVGHENILRACAGRTALHRCRW
jgi:hypothetical protein